MNTQQIAAQAAQSQQVIMELRGVVLGGIRSAELLEDNAQVIFDRANGSSYFEGVAAEAYAIGLAEEVNVEDLADVLVAAEGQVRRQERWGGVVVG